MTKRNKIIIAVVVDLLLTVVIDCLYGFTIGGDIGEYSQDLSLLKFLLAIIILCAGASTFTMALINGKDFFSTGKSGFFITLIAMCIVCTALYGPLNTLSQSEVRAEYDAVIADYYYANKGELRDTYVLEKADGSIIYKKELLSQPISFSDEEEIMGKTVHVKERMGGFGYPVYEVDYQV